MTQSEYSIELVVLLVEDDSLIRFDIAEYLKAHGWLVLEAATLKEALTLCGSDVQIDVLFTDIQLDGLTGGGWEIAETMRAAHPEVPVVYTSGNSADRSRSVTGSVFINKPYSPRHVLNTFRELIVA